MKDFIIWIGVMLLITTMFTLIKVLITGTADMDIYTRMLEIFVIIYLTNRITKK